jgi:hypothetical protein
MDLQWGESATEILERRVAASTARVERHHTTLQRQQRDGQGVTRPLEAVPEMDRYMYDIQGVSAAFICGAPPPFTHTRAHTRARAHTS